MKKSAPARLGKDAGDIGVLLPHFFVDRAFVANLMSFIPPAGWGLFRRQHQAVISDVRNIPAKAVRNLMAEDRAENLWVRNRSCIKNHAVSSPRRFVSQLVQPTYRTDRTILPDDNETFFRIISVLCTVALADCENGVFSNFIGLRKADLPFSHLLDSVALKT